MESVKAAGGSSGGPGAAGEPPALDRLPDGVADRLEAAIVGFESVRQRPGAVAMVVAAAVVIGAGAWWIGRPPPPVPVELAIPMASDLSPGAGDRTGTGSGGASPAGDPNAPGPPPGTSEEPVEFIVHVAGAVAEPGIVTLAPGARVVDAVEAAGGATAEADVHQLNLAAAVTDGMQIRVPLPGETVVQPVAPPGGEGQASDGGALVDINRAGAAELEQLRGIGPALAAAIVDWRQEHGPFSSVDDLLDVPGIGPAKLDGLVDQVVL